MIRPVLIYLDTCTWCRPFDDQTQDRIREETAAFYEIMLHVDRRDIEIAGSEALLAEIINPIDFVEGRLCYGDRV